MTIELSWYDQTQTILCFKFMSGYTWDDLAQVMAQGQAMMAQVDHPVDWLYYSESNRQEIPRGNPWHMFKAAQQKTPANTGLLCIVNPGLFVKMMERIGQTTIPQSVKLMRFAPTLDEGIKLLYAEREKQQKAT